VLKPAPESRELILVSRYEDVTVKTIRAATGWPLGVADTIDVILPPTPEELRVLRDLHARTRIAHAANVLPAKREDSPASMATHSHA
jgi:glutaconate CoA-transferase subunit B